MNDYALFVKQIIAGQIDEDGKFITGDEPDGESGGRSVNSNGPSRGGKTSRKKSGRNDGKRSEKAEKPAKSIDRRALGVCSQCNVKMRVSNNELVCQSCGATAEYEECEGEYASTSSIRIRVGNGYTTINNTTNSRKIQCDAIAANLSTRQTECMYNGDACIPNEVLAATVKVYNSIQNNIGCKNGSYVLLDPKGGPLPKGVRKWVHRSTPKDTIIMAIIYYKLHELGHYRSDKELKMFMNTPNGVSKGETVLRKIKDVFPSLDIELSISDMSIIPNITSKFLSTLNINYEDENVGTDVYSFVVDLTNRAIDETVGRKTLSPSKIAGAISIANELYGLGKTRTEIEAACDNTKHSTYYKFIGKIYKEKYIDLFEDIFSSYGFSTDKPESFDKVRGGRVKVTAAKKTTNRETKKAKAVVEVDDSDSDESESSAESTDTIDESTSENVDESDSESYEKLRRTKTVSSKRSR